MRSNLLSRLASAKSGRRSRSADGAVDDDSPSSMYSQASATTAGYWELEGEGNVVPDRGDVPPVPPLPAQYQDAAIAQRPPPPPPRSEARPQPYVAGWRPDLVANDSTLDSNPFDNGDGKETLAELEDSLAFPLPSPSRLSVPFPMKSPNNNNWFTSKFTSQSPSSTSPSPTTAYIYPSHPSYPSASSHPTEAVRALPTEQGNVMNVRNVDASRMVTRSGTVFQQHHAGESGTVGYQLPANWRPGQAVELRDIPTQSVAVQ